MIWKDDRGYGPSQIFEENGLKYQVCLIEIIEDTNEMIDYLFMYV